MPGTYEKESSLLILEQVLEGQESLRDSSRNKGASRHHLPPLLFIIKTGSPANLHQGLPPQASSDPPSQSVPALQVPAPEKASTNLAHTSPNPHIFLTAVPEAPVGPVED